MVILPSEAPLKATPLVVMVSATDLPPAPTVIQAGNVASRTATPIPAYAPATRRTNAASTEVAVGPALLPPVLTVAAVPLPPQPANASGRTTKLSIHRRGLSCGLLTLMIFPSSHYRPLYGYAGYQSCRGSCPSHVPQATHGFPLYANEQTPALGGFHQSMSVWCPRVNILCNLLYL